MVSGVSQKMKTVAMSLGLPMRRCLELPFDAAQIRRSTRYL